jgi:hypothetical protein
MKSRYGIAATVLLAVTIGSINAAGFDTTFERYFLDKDGGAIEVQTTHSGDKETLDAVRQRLQEEARSGIPSSTPALQEHQKQIQYRFEKTTRGARIRIKARDREALLAVQDFLRSRMSKPGSGGIVLFDYVANTSLIVVPVMINNHGPYKFLLDTGTTKTILSAKVADTLGLPKARIEMLLSAGGNLPVTARTLDVLQVGTTRAENVEIAVGNLPLMKTLQVEGLLGGDYLRRFKVSIDYDNMIVDIQPCCPESISLLT